MAPLSGYLRRNFQYQRQRLQQKTHLQPHSDSCPRQQPRRFCLRHKQALRKQRQQNVTISPSDVNVLLRPWYVLLFPWYVLLHRRHLPDPLRSHCPSPPQRLLHLTAPPQDGQLIWWCRSLLQPPSSPSEISLSQISFGNNFWADSPAHQYFPSNSPTHLSSPPQLPYNYPPHYHRPRPRLNCCFCHHHCHCCRHRWCKNQVLPFQVSRRWKIQV